MEYSSANRNGKRGTTMKTHLACAVAGVALLSASAAGAQAPQSPGSSHPQQRLRSDGQRRAAITAVLQRYQQALDASDVHGVVELYTDDAVVLPPNAPSAVGSAAVRATYKGIFQAIDLDLTFDIAEVKVASPNWAFLRSTSQGTITVLATGAQIPSSNHELFVLHRSRGGWKLARYSFSSVLPAA
jgi:uncharacterized protein (TIGR02246 family)